MRSFSGDVTRGGLTRGFAGSFDRSFTVGNLIDSFGISGQFLCLQQNLFATESLALTGDYCLLQFDKTSVQVAENPGLLLTGQGLIIGFDQLHADRRTMFEALAGRPVDKVS